MILRRKFVTLPAALCLVITGAGCGSAPAPDRLVTVSLSFAEPPPAGSSIDIRVVEVSGPDRAIAGSLTAPAGTGPFEIRIPGSRVRDSQQYGLELHVVQNGAAIMRNAEPYYVLTRGNPDRVSARLVGQ